MGGLNTTSHTHPSSLGSVWYATLLLCLTVLLLFSVRGVGGFFFHTSLSNLSPNSVSAHFVVPGICKVVYLNKFQQSKKYQLFHFNFVPTL